MYERVFERVCHGERVLYPPCTLLSSRVLDLSLIGCPNTTAVSCRGKQNDERESLVGVDIIMKVRGWVYWPT